MVEIEQVDQGNVLTGDQIHFQIAEEPADGKPEIIAHQNQALHVFAVAVPQRLDQFGVVALLMGVQPLLELIEND